MIPQPPRPRSQITNLNSQIRIRRHLIGILGLLLLIGAAITWNWETDTPWETNLQAACCRLGPLLIILWIALPQVERVPPWLWTYILIVLVLVALRPGMLLIVVPILVALAILKPRFGRRRRGQ